MTTFLGSFRPFLFFPLLMFISGWAHAQSNQNFDVSLTVDFSAVERLLDYFDRRVGNAESVVEVRGNRLAAATSVMLARATRPFDDFQKELELVRDNAGSGKDIYGLLPARNHSIEIRKLLIEVRRRQLERRVIATIASYFPEDVKISATVPVYVVAMGNERAAAVVRRVIWHGDIPEFVSEGRGEPVIILNLARSLEIAPTLESQYIEMLATLAHECFHAAFSVLKQSLPDSTKPVTLADGLLDLVQNEGVAYYLSMQIHLGGATPDQRWFSATSKAAETLNNVLREFHSPRLTRSRAEELFMNANLSGSFEGNYGATAGMRMAYEIDTRLGRHALTTTLSGGGKAFVAAYRLACLRDDSLPKLDGQ